MKNVITWCLYNIGASVFYYLLVMMFYAALIAAQKWHYLIYTITINGFHLSKIIIDFLVTNTISQYHHLMLKWTGWWLHVRNQCPCVTQEIYCWPSRGFYQIRNSTNDRWWNTGYEVFSLWRRPFWRIMFRWRRAIYSAIILLFLVPAFSCRFFSFGFTIWELSYNIKKALAGTKSPAKANYLTLSQFTSLNFNITSCG